MSIKVEPNITKDPYTFDTDQNGYPIFTKKNLALLHALLRYDSNYSASEDDKDGNTYAGMLAKNGVPRAYDDLYTVIKSIDKFSSTHLASEGRGGGGKGIEKTAKYIADSMADGLKERLSSRDDTLINEIATLGGKGKKNNFSFATKFCAYACVFAKDIRSDNFCVYDNVLANVLPYYAYLYSFEGIDLPESWRKDPPDLDRICHRSRNKDKNGDKRIISDIDSLCRQNLENHDYALYRHIVDSTIRGILEQSELDNLSYKDFDQLIWYYFKGRNPDEVLAHIPLPES